MKIMIPLKWTIAVFVLIPILAGCGGRTQPQAISSQFVPAGFNKTTLQHAMRSRSTSVMALGDPNVSASVKAHVIPGLPGSGRSQSPYGGPPR